MNKTEVLNSISWFRANRNNPIERPQDEILKKQVEKIGKMKLKEVILIESKPLNTSLNAFDNYSKEVRTLSKNQLLSIRKAGEVLDHKLSVKTCFIKGVSISDASHESNLRIIPFEWNSRKMKHNYIDDANRWILEKYGISEADIVCVTENGSFIYDKINKQT